MGRGKGYGTGSPISFLCAKGRREDWRSNTRYHTHNVKLTGRTKPRPHDGRRGARTTDTYREYQCSCGHVGWSAHVDLTRYKMPADGAS